jgi:hypothetical protein
LIPCHGGGQKTTVKEEMIKNKRRDKKRCRESIEEEGKRKITRKYERCN